MLGVSSILYVFQRSPFEDTRLVVGQSLPEGDLSIVHAALSTIGQCLPEDTAPLYDNTYSPITPFDDTQGGMTPDRFRLGDLEQRYAYLTWSRAQYLDCSVGMAPVEKYNYAKIKF